MLYCQAVFAVKYRKSTIQNSFKTDLCAVIGNLLKENEFETLIVNGVSDHVHCLFRFFPKHAVSDIMQSVKAKSSKWLNETDFLNDRFECQGGFGAFTYSEREISKVHEYILNQERHHQKITFQEEYLMMLKAHNIPFLPEYLFTELE